MPQWFPPLHPDSVYTNSGEYAGFAVLQVKTENQAEVLDHFMTRDLTGNDSSVSVADTPWASPIQRKDPGTGWVILITLGILALVAYLRVVDYKRLQQLTNAFISNRFIQQLLREEQTLTQRTSFGLGIAALLSTTLFLTQSLDILGWHLPAIEGPITYFGIIAVVLSGYWLIKLFIVHLSGFILGLQEATSEYAFNIFLFHTVGALALLPVSIGLTYLNWGWSTQLVWVGFGILGVLFISRLLKGYFRAAGSTSFSKFYIIMYLCTLEIWPLGVFWGLFLH